MKEEDIPPLGYAAEPPRPMRNKTVIMVGTTVVAIAAAGAMYYAGMARMFRPRGGIPSCVVNWQTQPAGGGPATQPSADDPVSDTAPSQ